MNTNAEITKEEEAAAKEKEDRLKAAATAEARRIAAEFEPVLARTVALAAFMLNQPPLIQAREQSIIHIQRVFADESLAVRRELVQHLFWPHVYEVLKKDADESEKTP